MAEVTYKFRGPVGVCGMTNENCIFNRLQAEGVEYSKSELSDICQYVRVGRTYDGVLTFKCPNMFTPSCGFSISCNNCGAELSDGKAILTNESVCPVCGNSVRPGLGNSAELTEFLRDGDIVELANSKKYRFFRNGLVEETAEGKKEIISAVSYIWNREERTFMSDDVPELSVKRVLRPKCYEGLSSTNSNYFSMIFEK